MLRLKYVRSPGPYRVPDGQPPQMFLFEPDDKQHLAELLPARFRTVPVPESLIAQYLTLSPGSPLRPDATVADWIVRAAEEAIGAHRSGHQMLGDGTPHTVASERAAIRRLIEALKPFTLGWLSEETCELIPAALMGDLKRQQKKLEAEPHHYTAREELKVLCATLGLIISSVTQACGDALGSKEKHAVVQFVDAALDHAGIAHPNFATNPRRLTALVFVG